MRAVNSKDTGPELALRRALHRLGFRYGLGGGGLPGRPDLVFRPRRAVIFVHGCFWHGHDCARGRRTPKTNVDYWRAKIARNVARDMAAIAALKRLGWRARVVWECTLGDPDRAAARAAGWLDRTPANP